MTLVMTRDLRRQESRAQQRAFERVRRAERQYVIQLRKIARNVGNIVKGFPPGDPAAEPYIQRALQSYAQFLIPWAQATAASMLVDVSRRDEKAWRQITEGMGQAMREEIRSAPVGNVFRAKMREQVALITSLPLEAAERVHKLTIAGLSDATRASEVAKEIARTGEVTESRAMLIARTEVGRAATSLTEARAQYIGSEGYIWRTANDADVRPSHKKMAGKFVRWDAPPTLDGLTGHAGALPNCRCYTEVVLPKEFR